MSHCKLDHLVVVAADLDIGRRYIEDLLGVETEPGGRHQGMNTHNRLLRLGNDQYLEIIAVDPGRGPADRPRWFALDDPAMQERVRDTPALVTWVARTDAVDETASRPPYRALELGDMARGELRWKMTFTPDGGLLFDGVVPLLIEWRTEATPPPRLPDSGCALNRFVVQTPEQPRVARLFEDLGLSNVTVEHSVRPGLAATLNTPARGQVVLSSAVTPGTGVDG